MQISIRVARKADFPILLELFRELALFEKLPHLVHNSVDNMIRDQNYFNCFIAESENKDIAGYTVFFFSYHTWAGKSLYIDDLYVKEHFRQQGIGKRLMQSVIDFAKKENCAKIRWQVSNWNKNAQDFYKGLGAAIDDVELNCDLLL